MSTAITSVADAERRAKRKLPRSVYRAFAGGSASTLADNLRAFREVGFRPRVGTGDAPRRLGTTILGHQVDVPLIVSPIGALRLAHREAEIGAAKGADALGIPVGVSTSSSHRIEDVAAAVKTPVWYQLYLAGGRSAAERAIESAREAGCAALVVTVDLLGVGAKESAARDKVPSRITVRNAARFAPEMMVRPRWFADYARDGLRLEAANVRDATGAALSFGEALPMNPTWDDIGWISEAWKGPLVVKGILRVDDARRALDAGARAIVVSNHGAFVLDGVPGSLRSLQSVAAVVGDQAELFVDGGVRTGADVVKALALGARAVLCGRACVWGLAAGGAAGVQRVLEVLRDEIEVTLAELGVESIEDLETADLDLPAAWPARTGPM